MSSAITASALTSFILVFLTAEHAHVSMAIEWLSMNVEMM